MSEEKLKRIEELKKELYKLGEEKDKLIEDYQTKSSEIWDKMTAKSVNIAMLKLDVKS